MAKILDLCAECAAILREGYTLQKIKENPVIPFKCDNCRKKKYGATYEVAPKRKG